MWVWWFKNREDGLLKWGYVQVGVVQIGNGVYVCYTCYCVFDEQIGGKLWVMFVCIPFVSMESLCVCTLLWLDVESEV